MAENSNIEWTDHTFNPWIGCAKVSPGCDNCYAEARMDTRLHRVHWGATEPRVRTKDWSGPERWNKQHAAFFAKHGRRQRVFCASLADVFDNQVSDDWRADLFDLIEATPNLDWLLLTKRVGNVLGMVPYTWTCPRRGWPAHVWLGATVVNQEEADRDIPKLLAVPARVRFLSMEPLLGPVDLSQGGHGWLYVDELSDGTRTRLHWVIAGGESGHGARPAHPDWFRSLRDQCAAAGVPFLFKQWGEWLPISQERDGQVDALYRSIVKAKDHEDQGALDESYGRRCTVPSLVVHHDGAALDVMTPMAFAAGKGAMQTFRVGKKAAGRQLDGATHDAFPEVR